MVMFCLTSKNEKERRFCLSFSHQLSMSFYRLLYPLWLDADVALRGACGTVLQEPLYKGNVIAIVLVDFCCVPLAEAVGADAVKAEIITDDGELLLYCSFRDWENQVILFYSITETVVFYVLLDHERDGEDASLAGFLLSDLKPESVAIPHNVAEPEHENIADTQTKIAFQHKRGGDAFIGAAAAETKNKNSTISFGEFFYCAFGGIFRIDRRYLE